MHSISLGTDVVTVKDVRIYNKYTRSNMPTGGLITLPTVVKRLSMSLRELEATLETSNCIFHIKFQDEPTYNKMADHALKNIVCNRFVVE